jgi:hypothetical protein
MRWGDMLADAQKWIGQPIADLTAASFREGGGLSTAFPRNGLNSFNLQFVPPVAVGKEAYEEDWRMGDRWLGSRRGPMRGP